MSLKANTVKYIKSMLEVKLSPRQFYLKHKSKLKKLYKQYRNAIRYINREIKKQEAVSFNSFIENEYDNQYDKYEEFIAGPFKEKIRKAKSELDAIIYNLKDADFRLKMKFLKEIRSFSPLQRHLIKKYKRGKTTEVDIILYYYHCMKND